MNREKLPSLLQDMFRILHEKIEILQSENKMLKKNIEMLTNCRYRDKGSSYNN